VNTPDVLVGSLATLDDAAVTALHDEAEQQAATLLRQHAVMKLATAMVLDVKRDCPAPPPTTAEQAGAVLRTLSARLDEASRALFLAADRLKKHGDAHGASLTYAAARRTQLAAHALD
jgi:hypothetical protein